VKCAGGSSRIKLAVTPNRLAGRKRLDLDSAAAQRLDHGWVGFQLPIGPAAQDQSLGQFLDHVVEVLHGQRVAVLAPPIRHHAVGHHD